MKIDYTRKDYYKIKHNYLFFRFFLQIIRILVIFYFVAIFVFLILTNNIKDSNTLAQITEITSKFITILTTILLVLWIIIKIINVVFVKKLKKIKSSLEIVDEI